jgi:hypothetical protein
MIRLPQLPQLSTDRRGIELWVDTRSGVAYS